MLFLNEVMAVDGLLLGEEIPLHVFHGDEDVRRKDYNPPLES